MTSPLLQRLLSHPARDDVAVLDDDSSAAPTTYGELLARANVLAARLRDTGTPLDGAPVVFLAAPSAAYVEALLGIWLAGGCAVPLSPLHTTPEWLHVLDNAAPSVVLTTAPFVERVRAVAPSARVLILATPEAATEHPVDPARHPAAAAPAIMLYTSGTTGKPKGVVLSHAAVAATLDSLDQAWGWRRDDRLLHLLPLHHTHGVIVALLGALWAGACVRFAAFDARPAWALLGEVSVFMAVPTIYAKLLEAFRAADPALRAIYRANAARLRLFTSGSAALPATLLDEFRGATGQTILERYGMTEIGMALSNPLTGTRVPGAVGRELPGVHIDIVPDDADGGSDGRRLCGPGEPGELRVRSPQLFSGYHRDPTATAAAYDSEGRFRTGDTGVRDAAGVVRLLGRTAVDVLKSGGYKLSALEIEDALRAHPAIADIAVVGLPDATWGDLVTACVVVRPGSAITLNDLRAYARDVLAPYKIPRRLVVVPALPRNAMGKVQKGVLKAELA